MPLRNAFISICVLPLLLHQAHAEDVGRLVEVRIGAASTNVDLDSLPLQTLTHRDAQFGGTFRYRGIPLEALIRHAAAPTALDLALLHFANGMVVPLPIHDSAAMARLDPLVARGMAVDASAIAVGRFPPMPKKQEEYPDTRPRDFGGNRVVVNERWHPALAAGAEKTFSPWASVDTLVAIVLVDAAAYDGQLPAGTDALSRRGRSVFQETCGFCHAVHGVGGHFGWDLVDPEPIYSDAWMRRFKDATLPTLGARRASRELSSHVRFPSAASAGRWMPALRQLTAADVDALWAWLHVAARSPP